MSMKGSIVDRVNDYINGSEKIEAKGMARLSQEAVAVWDNYDETDVYFDRSSYRIVKEYLWKNDNGECSLFPPALEGTGLGVLCSPHVRDFTDALQFAKQQLKPLVKKARFHRKPVELK